MSTVNTVRTPGQSETASPWKTAVSLLIFVHVFFVFLALSGTYLRSGFTATLLRRFAFYTRALNLDPGPLPYYLTHGTDADVDHRVEVQFRGSDRWHVLPGDLPRGWDGYQRYQRYAAGWGFQAVEDGQPALFAQAVGTHYARRSAEDPALVRCRKHFQIPREDLASGVAGDRDPDSASRFTVSYAANTLVNTDRSVSVIRAEDSSQVAAPVTRGGEARGSGGR